MLKLTARLFGSVYGTIGHHLGEHWLLSREEQTLLSTALFDLLKALPKSSSKRVQNLIKEWMPYAAFLGVVFAITYPRVSISAEMRRARRERGNNNAFDFVEAARAAKARTDARAAAVAYGQAHAQAPIAGSGTADVGPDTAAAYTASPLNNLVGRAESVGLGVS